MSLPPAPTLETARLRLRPYRLDDFDAYAALWADPDVTRFVGGAPFPREEAWTRFLRQGGMWRFLGFGFFAVVDRDSGAYLGDAGVQDRRRDITPSLDGALEAGWALTPAAQGRGLATEAMRAVFGWTDATWPGRPVTCIIAPGHTVSLRVAAKLGFVERARADYGGRPVVLLERGTSVAQAR